MQSHGQQGRARKIISIVALVLLLLGTLTTIVAGIAVYSIYNNVRDLTLDGVSHLENVKYLFPDIKSNPMGVLDAKKLVQTKNEFSSAQDDFLALQRLVNRSDIRATVAQVAPQYSSALAMAGHLVTAALDATKLGQELSGVGTLAATIVHSSPLASGSTQPLISASDVATIEATLTHAQYYLNDIQSHLSQVQLQDLPLSASQQKLLSGLVGQLPKAQDMLGQAQQLVGVGAWLLGVDHQRRFLVQTMDRAELRPGGGFTGQYGVLQIQDGRMGSLSLRDVALLDYAGNGVELGRQAPPEYRSWMDFGNWGLRDSNLSGDYPTTARLNMQVFQDEGGGPVDGDIAFTPTFIGHILDVTGPIYVAEYNETITSKNLEERLHYYQQDYSAIAEQRQKTNDNSHQARKAFTSLVGKLLLERVRHLTPAQLVTVAKSAIKDIQARDLEIYFSNPQTEAWLLAQGYSGAMPGFSQQDGFMVVQANISISKASTYVHTTEHDDVTLDTQGGATHHLTITLNYQQTGPVYGFDTYADYIRVYAPSTAQFISGSGFDSGLPLCSGSTCGAISPEQRSCPNGNTNLGDRYFHQPWRVDQLGGPTALTSDLPGRAMFGGLTETPKNCISTITLAWYIPNAVKQRNGHASYEVMIGKQGGYIPTVELAIDTQALETKGLHLLNAKSRLLADTVFRTP